MLVSTTGKTLTHDVLTTFMAEVCAIINSRPAYPPRVLRETIVHGPKASTPTLVKGGDGSTRSVGRSAIICCSVFPLSLRQVIHLWIMDDTKRFDPIIQNRFTSVRGKVKIFRSDRGTNFVGAVDDLKIDAINVEDGPYHVSCVKLLSMVRRHPLQH
jgi:hypothetical protein